MSFRTLYFLAAGIIIVDGIFLAILPFPPKEEAPKAADGTVEKRKMKLTPSAILLVCIGFTASTTFMLFMNCNQELGTLYGLADPSKIQSFYSVGIVVALFVSAALLKRNVSAADGLCRPVILDDVSLNAKGYERLAERLTKNDEQ